MWALVFLAVLSLGGCSGSGDGPPSTRPSSVNSSDAIASSSPAPSLSSEPIEGDYASAWVRTFCGIPQLIQSTSPAEVDHVKSLLRQLGEELENEGQDSLARISGWLARNLEIPSDTYRITASPPKDIGRNLLVTLERDIRSVPGVEKVFPVSAVDLYEEAMLLSEGDPEYQETLTVDMFGPEFEIVVIGRSRADRVTQQLETNPLIQEIHAPPEAGPFAGISNASFKEILKACS